MKAEIKSLFSVARIPRDLSRGWVAGVRRSSLERRRIGLWRISLGTTALRLLSASFFCFLFVGATSTCGKSRTVSVAGESVEIDFPREQVTPGSITLIHDDPFTHHDLNQSKGALKMQLIDSAGKKVEDGWIVVPKKGKRVIALDPNKAPYDLVVVGKDDRRGEIKIDSIGAHTHAWIWLWKNPTTGRYEYKVMYWNAIDPTDSERDIKKFLAEHRKHLSRLHKERHEKITKPYFPREALDVDIQASEEISRQAEEAAEEELGDILE